MADALEGVKGGASAPLVEGAPSAPLIGRVYKLFSPSTDRIYIGSTCKTLQRRLAAHKRQSNTCSSNTLINYMDLQIECLEELTFTNRDQLLWRERHYYELHKDKCVNINYPIRSLEEDKAFQKQFHHDYQLAHKARLKAYAHANYLRYKAAKNLPA
jgi:hypothetical protein